MRRDEEAAKEREQAEEQRIQEIDAARRLAILRGEVPPPLPPAPEHSDSETRGRGRDRDSTAAWGKERKKRKRAGEDDTDFELRVARERAGEGQARKAPEPGKQTSGNAPLTDAAGHIDLFPEDRASQGLQKNPEAEKEAAKKKKDLEDQYTMRFSNAAGKDGLASGPWYAAGGELSALVAREIPSKNVWGNDDPRRKEREAARVVSSDPLAMMKMGAAKVREVEKERKAANEAKRRETKQLMREERRQRKRRRSDEDDLEGFALDGPSDDKKRQRQEDEGERKHRHTVGDGQRIRRHSEHHHRHENHHHESRRDQEGEGRHRHDSGRRRRDGARTDHY